MNQLQFETYQSKTVHHIWETNDKYFKDKFLENDYDLLVFNHINAKVIDEIIGSSLPEKKFPGIDVVLVYTEQSLTSMRKEIYHFLWLSQ